MRTYDKRGFMKPVALNEWIAHLPVYHEDGFTYSFEAFGKTEDEAVKAVRSQLSGAEHIVRAGLVSTFKCKAAH